MDVQEIFNYILYTIKMIMSYSHIIKELSIIRIIDNNNIYK